MLSPWLFVSVFASAWLIVSLLTPLAIKLGRRLDIVDRPGGRRTHRGEIVRIGGLGIFPAFAIAALIPVLVGSPRDDALELTRLTGVLLGMAIIWITGLADDRYKLPPAAQLGGSSRERSLPSYSRCLWSALTTRSQMNRSSWTGI